MLSNCAPSAEDHPRVCGEKTGTTSVSWKLSGSPPRMRGKVPSPQKGEATLRITPAYAGKSLIAERFFVCVWDHPRVCGEKSTSPLRLLRPWGSPPRMRGKDSRITRCWGLGRITPRVCGEKRRAPQKDMQDKGSPPRMRGKGAGEPLRLLDRGITPAYAGKSAPLSVWLYLVGDHPRVCGEKFPRTWLCYRRVESPPRMRGKVCASALL